MVVVLGNVDHKPGSIDNFCFLDPSISINRKECGGHLVSLVLFSRIMYGPVALICVFCEINIAALDYFVCSTKMLSPAVNHLYLALIFAMPLW